MAEDPVIPCDLPQHDGFVKSEDEICVRLQTPQYIVAFLKKEELDRNIAPILSDQSLLEDVTGNYVIVKKIISFLRWQDKLMCKHVCPMWESVVNTLQREQLSPSDFAVSLRLSHIRNGIKLIHTENFNSEPLVVLAFANTSGFTVTRKCEMYVPCPCEPPCGKEHYLVDVMQHQMTVPKRCMLTVKACYLSYMPLPQSVTYQHAINRQTFGRSSSFIGGIYIPNIPGVGFKVININSVNDTKDSFIKKVDKLSETHYVKGVLVFVNESFLLQSVEDIVFLNYFKDVQPNVPYALGGCIVEDTMFEAIDMDIVIEGKNDGVFLISENLMSIALFTVPKHVASAEPDHGCKFDMYSLVIESSDWSKAKIESVITEFSKKVPHFEHSVVIKLSCVGRDQKHDYEQEYFRAAFPNTRLVGCYGNGELGVNHPERPPPEDQTNTVKRHRRDPGPQYGIMYSYSTVFVYIGWGKIITPPEPV